MKEVYQTRDGQVFEGRADAEAHEETLFNAWLTQAEAQTLTVQDILEGLDTYEDVDYFATPQAIFLDLLRGYFDTHEECGV